MSDLPLNEDFRDLLELFVQHEVRFLLVGAHAMAVHGIARATLDIDVWVEPSSDNAVRVVAALRDFGAPLTAHDLGIADFEKPNTVYQLGLPPRRIDVLTSLSGLSFESAWKERSQKNLDGLPIHALSLNSLLVNKRASGRPKDLADIERIERARGRE